MLENIPDMEITFGVVVAVAVFFAFLAIVSEFVLNKKAEATARKAAKLSGEVYDEVNGEISQKMFWGYPLIAVVGAAIIATIVMFGVNEIAVSSYGCYVETSARAMLVGGFISIIAFMLVDKVLLRKVMDGLFFAEVESPAIDTFLNGGAAAAEEIVEKVNGLAERVRKLRAAGYSDDDIDVILAESKK